MNRILTTLIAVILYVLPCIAQLRGKVVKVADGDTFTMLIEGNKQVKIRLHGIDCPEKAQPFGTRAKQFTSELVFGRTVKAQIKDTDGYSRVIAIVTIVNRTVNEELLMSGFAWHYKKYDDSPWYARLEEAARAARFGLWEDQNPVPPWEWRKKK